jgi:hypothetical protein
VSVSAVADQLTDDKVADATSRAQFHTGNASGCWRGCRYRRGRAGAARRTGVVVWT